MSSVGLRDDWVSTPESILCPQMLQVDTIVAYGVKRFLSRTCECVMDINSAHQGSTIGYGDNAAAGTAVIRYCYDDG